MASWSLLCQFLSASASIETKVSILDTLSCFVGQIPSVGGNEEPVDKEQAAEDERLRQEAIKEAEEKRRVKHKKMEEERENMRQGIRDR